MSSFVLEEATRIESSNYIKDDEIVLGDHVFSVAPFAFGSAPDDVEKKHVLSKVDMNLSGLVSISGRRVLQIEEFAFSGLFHVRRVEFPVVEEIGSCAFKDCRNVIKLEFPKLLTLKDRVFSGCINVEVFEAPLLELAGQYCFENCLNLSEVNAQNLIVIESFCFAGTKLLKKFMAENTKIDLQFSAFEDSSVEYFEAKHVKALPQRCFAQSKLKYLNLMMCTDIGAGCFEGLQELHLMAPKLQKEDVSNYHHLEQLYVYNGTHLHWAPSMRRQSSSVSELTVIDANEYNDELLIIIKHTPDFYEMAMEEINNIQESNNVFMDEEFVKFENSYEFILTNDSFDDAEDLIAFLNFLSRKEIDLRFLNNLNKPEEEMIVVKFLAQKPELLSLTTSNELVTKVAKYVHFELDKLVKAEFLSVYGEMDLEDTIIDKICSDILEQINSDSYDQMKNTERIANRKRGFLLQKIEQ